MWRTSTPLQIAGGRHERRGGGWAQKEGARDYNVRGSLPVTPTRPRSDTARPCGHEAVDPGEISLSRPAESPSVGG
jgi:hypothetical protein